MNASVIVENKPGAGTQIANEFVAKSKPDGYTLLANDASIAMGRALGVPLKYDPLYWGMVFPLAMYSVCTFRLATVFDLASLVWVSRTFAVAGIVAWVSTFLGLAGGLVYLVALALRSTARSIDERSATREDAVGGQQ